MRRTKISEGKGGHRPLTVNELRAWAEDVMLPGVKRIIGAEMGSARTDVKSGFAELRREMRAGFNEMRQGFRDVDVAIRALAAEVTELKVTMQDEKNEARIRRLEQKRRM
jgi:hypothetical protein